MSSANESYPTHVLSGDIIPPEQPMSGNHYTHPDIAPWPYTHEEYQTQQLQAAQPRKQKYVPTPPSTPQAPDGCMWYVHPVTGQYDIMRIPEQSPRTKGGKRRKLIKSRLPLCYKEECSSRDSSVINHGIDLRKVGMSNWVDKKTTQFLL